ncbi:hypothetical protein ABZX95_40655 [Streptomyces sp. NPDC004232]|uniref:hypothetical protein n=1 Tax=Streptomyces sp. NPDC004232 TaxID=3154454 RepID=UPI0033BA38E2
MPAPRTRRSGGPRGVLAQDDRGPGHAFGGGGMRLDLAQFDAEPAQFDLAVGPSGELQPPVDGTAHQVPAAVHARPRWLVRVGDEASGGVGPGRLR